MNRKLLCSIWMMLLLLFSCSENSEQPIASAEDKEYVTLNLRANQPVEDSETLRSYGHMRFAEGTDGKPRVEFLDVRTGQTSGQMPIYVMILKGETVIYAGSLMWDIEDAGRRLSYHGPIKIEKSLLAGSGELTIYAHVNRGRMTRTETINASSFSLSDGKKREMEIPFIMHSPIELEGNTLYLRDRLKAKFKPSGVLVSLKIVNNLPVSIIGHDIVFCYDPSHENYSYPILRVYYDRFGMQSPELPYYRFRKNSSPDFTVVNEVIARSALGGDFGNGYEPIAPGQAHTEYIWLSEPQLEGLSHINFNAVGLAGRFTKVGGEPKEGRLLEYSIEFKPQDYSLNKGMYKTDNHGNVIPLLDERDESISDNFYNIEQTYFVLYGYMPDEIRSKTTSDDAWLARYYIPSFFSGLHSEADRSDAELKDYIINIPSPKPGLTEANLFDNPEVENLSRDLVKFSRGGALIESRTKAVYRRGGIPAQYYGTDASQNYGAFYMMRFLDQPDQRVFQRVRWVPYGLSPVATGTSPDVLAHGARVTREWPYYEVSFLPYDAQGLVGDAALTEEYWAARESQVQKIYIRLPFATKNINPAVSEIHSIATINDHFTTVFTHNSSTYQGFSGMAYWSNNIRGFYGGYNNLPRFRHGDVRFMDHAYIGGDFMDRSIFFLPLTR